MDWPSRHHRCRGRRKNTNTPPKDTEDDNPSEAASKAAVPRAGLYMLSEFPKQFVLSCHEEDAIMNLDRSLSDTDADWLQETPRDPAELRRLARELESFEDMDYMLPGHLEELLRQEGVDDQVVDSTVAVEKVWHDRALYLNHIYHIRRRKFLARPSRYSSLPPIHRNPLPAKDPPTPTPDPSLPPPSHDVDARRERRENRSRPWDMQDFPTIETPVKLSPKPVAVTRSTEVKVRPKEQEVQEKTRRELELFRTEVDRVRWEAERVEEIASLPSEFIQPRLVFISSKVARCYSMSKAIRRGDNSILYNVYDFDKCNFADILNTAKAQLEAYRSGCKAKSILFMCQGAQGCLYMFHKIVLTPQKMKKVQYQQIKEFWRSLGDLLTKVEPEDTAVHLLGGQLDNAQGKALLYEVQKAMLPSLATVGWVVEDTDEGRETVEQYFDFRKFILWRAKHDSSNSLDYTDITRSWSSLADEAEDMDHR
ncbi:hypothetical protein ACOMHN_007421 [Nucella lapillus]